MKLLLLLGSLLLASPATSPLSAPAPRSVRVETVYVCMSKTSYAYHASSNCSGLNRCTHEVKPMSAAAAQELGKRTCKKCY